MSLWNRNNKSTFIASPQLRIYIDHLRNKETSFYTCPKSTINKGSLTVEAAVIIPVISCLFVTILFFFHVMFIQLRVEEALIYAGRKVAVESSIVSEETMQFASAKALVLWHLREEPLISKYVQGESLGVVLLGSEFESDYMTLQATYRVEFPIKLFGIDGITLWNRNTFQKWVGDLPKEDRNQWVYITPGGEVYHKLQSCRALTIRVKSAFLWSMNTIRGENGQKYYACSRCVENISEDDLVYFTDYGELYHGRLNCRSIKRTIDKKKLSEVEDRRPCKLCCGGDSDD